ncbi:hypothetical protein Tco_1556079 [Tanacetum coccineum]
MASPLPSLPPFMVCDVGGRLLPLVTSDRCRLRSITFTQSDLGGGTIDVSILEISNDVYEDNEPKDMQSEFPNITHETNCSSLIGIDDNWKGFLRDEWLTVVIPDFECSGKRLKRRTKSSVTCCELLVSRLRYNFKATVTNGTANGQFTFFTSAGDEVTGHPFSEMVANRSSKFQGEQSFVAPADADPHGKENFRQIYELN